MSELIIVYAAIGAGKSRFAVSALCHELQNSERMIVTNLPVWVVNPPPGRFCLGEWCHKYVQKPVDINARVRLITRAQVKDFYRYLPGDLEMPWIDEKLEPRKRLPNLQWRQDLADAGVIPRGCLNIIDEAHLTFGSRNWQESAVGVGHYVSQLRKFNDDLMIVTQNPGKLDKNFRRDCTMWIHLTNKSKVTYLMGVKFPGKFSAREFDAEPSKFDKPVRTSSFSLEEEELHKCYDTSAGVGLSGSLLPEKAASRGGHWWRWVVAAVLFLVAAIMGPRLLMSGAGSYVGGLMGTFHRSAQKALPKVSAATNGVQSPSLKSDDTLSKPSYTNPYMQPPVSFRPEVDTNVFFDGTAISGPSRTWLMSDGQVWRLGDGHVQRFGAGWVQVDGVIYRQSTPYERTHRKDSENESPAQRRKILHDSQ